MQNCIPSDIVKVYMVIRVRWSWEINEIRCGVKSFPAYSVEKTDLVCLSVCGGLLFIL